MSNLKVTHLKLTYVDLVDVMLIVVALVELACALGFIDTHNDSAWRHAGLAVVCICTYVRIIVFLRRKKAAQLALDTALQSALTQSQFMMAEIRRGKAPCISNEYADGYIQGVARAVRQIREATL